MHQILWIRFEYYVLRCFYYLILFAVIVYYLQSNVAECYWEFPLERDVAAQSWQECPYWHEELNLYDEEKIKHIAELRELREANRIKLYPLIHHDARVLHENILMKIKENSPMSFNEMLSIIYCKSTIFLVNCTYKPMSFEECQDPNHAFNAMLTILAAAERNSPFTTVKNIVRITGASLIIQTMSCYPDLAIPKDLELVEKLRLGMYLAIYY